MRRTKNKKWKTARYAEYHKKMMEPILTERWEKSLNRVRVLKKTILKLGKIPTEEKQLIKTINYFIKFIDVLTDFYDNGVLKCAPEEKRKAVLDFDCMIFEFVARDRGTIFYLNKSEIGQRVTADNLCLGLFGPITDKDNPNNIRSKEINGRKLKVKVDYTPISEWINKKAVTLEGYPASISQKDLANGLKEIQSIALKCINKILD